MEPSNEPFFHKAVTGLCGALSMEALLREVRLLLRHWSPVDKVLLYCVRPDRHSVELAAYADQGGSRRDGRILGETKEIIKMLQTIGVPLQLAGRASLSAAARPLVERGLLTGDTALMVIRLVVDETVLGLLFAGAEPGKEFTPEHARRCKGLRSLLSIGVKRCLHVDDLEDQRRRFEADLEFLSRSHFDREGSEVVGADMGLRPVMTEIRRAGSGDRHLVIRGERGVGKGLLARTSHFLSNRQNRSYLECNCRLIPDGQRDAHFLGDQGAGAAADKAAGTGLLLRAKGGTLILRGCDLLSEDLQQCLDTLCTTGELRRRGFDLHHPGDLRLIVLVDEYEAVPPFLPPSVQRIRVPPLRERLEDITRLIQYFLERTCRCCNRLPMPVLDQQSLDRALTYHWPGNVGELRAVVERGVLLSAGSVVHLPDLWGYSVQRSDTTAEVHGESVPLDRLISDHIKRTLRRTGGKVGGPHGAAALLGINPSTLRKRMRKLEIPFGRKVTY